MTAAHIVRHFRFAPVEYRIMFHAGPKTVRGYAVDSPEMVCVRKDGSRWVADHWPTGYSVGVSADSRDRCASLAVDECIRMRPLMSKAIERAKFRGHYPANPMP